MPDRWPLLAMIVALLLCLAPAAALGQGLKDSRDDDPAAEEAAEEPFDPVEQASEWEDAGLIDDQSYESPQFGYTIEWSTGWAVDAAVEELYGYQPVTSDEENEQDIIYLLWSNRAGDEAYVIVSGQTANRGGPDDEVDEWTDPDWIEQNWEPNIEVEVLLDDTTRDAAAVLYAVEDSEEPASPVYYTIYQSIALDDGTTLYLTFSASAEVAEDAYESWASEVEIDGAPIDVVFDWDEIEAAI